MLSSGPPYLTGIPPDTTNRDLEERKKLELKLKMEKDQPWELPEWVREVTGWNVDQSRDYSRINTSSFWKHS